MLRNTLRNVSGPGVSLDTRGLGWEKAMCGTLATRVTELLYPGSPWAERWPELKNVTTDTPCTPIYCEVSDNTVSQLRFFSAWLVVFSIEELAAVRCRQLPAGILPGVSVEPGGWQGGGMALHAQEQHQGDDPGQMRCCGSVMNALCCSAPLVQTSHSSISNHGHGVSTPPLSYPGAATE